jgi:hypothetical protein
MITNAAWRMSPLLWSALAALLLWASPAVLVLWSSAASAAVTEEGAPNFMVRPFDGPKAKALQERVVKVLEEQGADLVPAGFEGPTPLETDADYASVAARLNIRAYIQGQVSNDNTGWKLTLTVRQGADGTVKGSSEFTASWFPGLLTKIDEELITKLEAAMAGSEPPKEPEIDEPVEEEAPVEEKPRPRPLELNGGLGFVFRNYVANNPINIAGVVPTRNQSGGMASLRVGAAFYPMALFSNSFLANIGLIGRFERSLGGTTQAGEDPNQNLPSGDLDTALTAYDVGLRVRLPVADHELGFSAAYGAQQFEIDDGGTESDPALGAAKLVPDVDYGFIRLGTDFTYNMKQYFMRGDVGLRVVDSAGEDPGQIQDDRWFPESDVMGVDFGAMAGYALSERFTITLGLDFRNFFYSMNSRPEDFGLDPDNNLAPTGERNPVAGGANDMYFAGMISARYSLQ